MEKLAESYKVSGMIYKLHQRTEHKAWYCCNLTGNTIHEVFVIKVYAKGELYGRSYPERESKPSDNSFGKTAWSISGVGGYERAKKCYEALDDLIRESPELTEGLSGQSEDDDVLIESGVEEETAEGGCGFTVS
jgi:hypothetical protein